MNAATVGGALTREQRLAAVLRERYAEPTGYRLAPVVEVGRLPANPLVAIEARRDLAAARRGEHRRGHLRRLMPGRTPKEPTP